MVIPIYSRLLYYTLFSGVHHLGSQYSLFQLFFKTINSSIYNWFGYGATTAGMIFGETSFIFLFSGISLDTYLWLGYNCIIRLFYRLSIKVPNTVSSIQRISVFITGVACIGLCLFGIRGRMGYNPIKVSQAYYCEDPF